MKRLFYFGLSVFLTTSLHGNVTALFVANLTSKTYEATSTRNPVLYIKITDDGGGDTLNTLTVENTMIFGAPFDAREPNDLVRVQAWLDADGTVGTADDFSLFLGTMTVDASQMRWTLTGLAQAVSNNQGILFTVDVQNNTANGGSLSGPRAMRFQMSANGSSFQNAGTLPSANLQNSDIMFLTTETPAENFQISLFQDSEPIFGAGQTGVRLAEWLLKSDPSPGHSNDAPTLLRGMMIYFRDNAGNTVTPSSVLKALEVRDQFTVYMSKTQTQSAYITSNENPADGGLFLDLTQQSPDGVWIDPTQSPQLGIFADILPNVTLTTLHMEIFGSGNFQAFDLYSNKPVTAVASPAFPLVTSDSIIQGPADTLNATFSALVATEIAKGEKNVPILSMTLENVGPPATGKIDVKTLHFSLWDAANNPIPANTLLDRVVIYDAADPSAIYSSFAVRNDAISNTVVAQVGFSPSDRPLVLAASSPVTTVVQIDLKGDAIPSVVQFKILDLSDISSWKAVQFGVSPEVPVNSFGNTPFATAAVSIVTALNVQHQSKLPATLFAGQTGVPVMDLTFTHPGPTVIGDIVLNTLTFRLKDQQGAALDASTILSSAVLQEGSLTPAQTFVLSNDQVTITFTGGVTLTPNTPANTKTLSFFVDLASAANASGLSFQLTDANAVTAIQTLDPSRKVKAVPTAGDAFPMTSSTASLQSSEFEKSFTNFPNPFAPGKNETTFSYFLPQPARVSLRLYTVTGEPVRTILDGVSKNAGAHQEDRWDGKNDRGEGVLNGVYVALLEIEKQGGFRKKTKRFVVVQK